MTGRLDDALAAQAAAQIMTLDASSDAPIDVGLSSRDGALEAASALIDVIDGAHAPIRIRCQGHVAGPAIGVLAAADQRSASAHTTFRLSLPMVKLSGSPDQIAAQSEEHRRLLWRFHARLAQATGRAAEDVADDMRRVRYLDAREALDYGLIEAILS